MSKKANHSSLYIIGNGFDLHHGLDTWYSSFGLFIKKDEYEIYDVFIEYYGFGDLDENDKESLKDPLWSDFESSLAQMDGELLLDNHAEHIPNYGSDDFRDRDRYDIQIYIQDIVEKATLKMRQAFESFIQKVEYPNVSSTEHLNLEKDALYLSFNYTDTLERYYQVERTNIEYIHNKAGEEPNLILGHGIDPKEFEKKEEIPPEDPEERERWEEMMSDNYDYSVELGKDEVRSYFLKSFKPTKDVLEKKISFFNRLTKIRKVFVLGHSLSEVDRDYFDQVIHSISKNSIWVVSYYNPNERNARKNRLTEFGIEKRQIILIQMDELIPNTWNKVKLFMRIAFAQARSIVRI